MTDGTSDDSVAPGSWATVTRVVWAMSGQHRTGWPDPCGLILSVLQCELPIRPTEYFSDKTPVRASLDGEVYPIDELLGSYDPAKREIEIFHRNVRRFCKVFDATFDELLFVVRLHEHAHAAAHLAISPDGIEPEFTNAIAAGGRTDWTAFLARRLASTKGRDARNEELLAQAITFSALQLLAVERKTRMLQVFEAVERKQPAHYIVSDDIKACVMQVDWPLVITGFADWTDPTSQQDGRVAALLRSFGKPVDDSVSREWAFEVNDASALTELRHALVADDAATSQAQDPDRIELLVDRFANLRVEVFAREHGVPHFRVTDGERAANYRIADCGQLNGTRHFSDRAIRRWYEGNREKLIAAWDRMRPTDCPVGPFRD